MTNDPIPDDVRRLVEQHFTSVSELEALLALIRDRRRWTAHDLARSLVINDEHAAALLGALVRMQLVTADGGTYAFEPPAKRDRVAAECLAELYDKYRLRIMNIVFSKPSDPLREFGDAFRLRQRDGRDEGGT